jgi:hypothetical protein
VIAYGPAMDAAMVPRHAVPFPVIVWAGLYQVSGGRPFDLPYVVRVGHQARLRLPCQVMSS